MTAFFHALGWYGCHESHVATYIERDDRQIRNIPDLRVFNQFLNLVAVRHGQEFHAANLSRELGITQPTVKSWGSVLEASYIAHSRHSWRWGASQTCTFGARTTDRIGAGHLALPWHAFPQWLRARLG